MLPGGLECVSDRNDAARHLNQKADQDGKSRDYLISTLAPTASSFFLISSASGFSNAFFEGLRRAFNEVFSFFQAETRDRANFFNDVDFLLAGGRQEPR